MIAGFFAGPSSGRGDLGDNLVLIDCVECDFTVDIYRKTVQ